MIENPRPALQGIISGGQTGADRGGLDGAIEIGIRHGGWCPKGRLAEDGVIPKHYLLQETASRTYPERTVRNIKDSDGTAVFTYGEATGGSKMTIREAIEAKKPVLHIDLAEEEPLEVISRIRTWCLQNNILVLNVAGSRESKARGIQTRVREVVKAAFAQR